MNLPNPNTKITYPMTTVYGGPVTVGRRTGAHLDYTRERLERQHSGCELRIIQSAYNTGVPASAGTHDYDAALDTSITGLDWWTAQRFLRESGWAAWYRYPPAFSSYHIHMVSIGYGSAPVGVYIPGQVDDYYNHRSGLSGHYADNTWHPENIEATVFDYRAWEANLVTPEDLSKIRSMVDDDGDKTRALINKRAVGERARDKAQTDKLAAAIDALPDGDFSKTAVRAVLDNWATDQAGEEETP